MFRFCLAAIALAAGEAMPAPVILDVSPTFGAPGTTVTISGYGFAGVTTLKFDNALADFYGVGTNDTVLLATVPLDATTGPLHLAGPSGTGDTSGAFVVAPRIIDFFPLRGPVNAIVTINGFNFNGTTNVQFNGTNAAFVIPAPTQLQTAVPVGATSGPITVTTAAGTAVSPLNFVVIGAGPLVDAFSPPLAAPGAQIIIYGINFFNVTGVSFNGVAATIFAAPASSQMLVIVPPGASTGKVTVTTTAGSGTSLNDFMVTALPVITNFSPVIGQPGQTQVTIQGVNFSGLTGVSFNGCPASGFSSPAPNQISVTVPNCATIGPIVVANTFGSGSSGSNFIATTAPYVTSFNPTLGVAGNNVLIVGANFNGVTAVTFNGVLSDDFSAPAQTQLNARVPAGATTGPISVYHASGSFVTPSNFVVAPGLPYLTQISPNAGPRGTPITIRGVNFVPNPVVQFNSMPDPTAYVAGSSGLETIVNATVPAAATTGPITVTNAAGTSTNNILFYVPPRLAGFTPASGSAGSAVFLDGTSFTGATQVLFNQTPAAFTVNSANRITAIVPTNALNGPISVVAPAGVIISTNQFTVTPLIASFAPAQGPTGTVVTISGTSLQNAQGVWFNNQGAGIADNSATEIRTVVPPTATTGPIRVQTPNGVAVSTNGFLVTGSSDVSLNAWNWANLVLPGQPITYTFVILNQGPWTVTGVRVQGALPAATNFTFLSVSTDRGSCVQSNGQLTCDLGYLTNGASATIRVTGQFRSETNFVFRPTVTSFESDTNLLNNTYSMATLVISNTTRTLSIARVPRTPKVTLSWPVSPVTLRLLTSSNFATWAAVSNIPAAINGRNVVTNAASDPRRFYRLTAP